jgi:hypothetical protein
MMTYAQDDNGINPLDSLDFTIDYKDTPLKFADTIIETGAVFTIDGNFPSAAEDVMNYMIIIPTISVTKEQQKETAIKNAKTNTKSLKIAKINAIKIGALSGYEIIRYELENGHNTLRYTAILFDVDRYYEFVGYTKNKLDERLEIFKRLTRSFNKK